MILLGVERYLRNVADICAEVEESAVHVAAMRGHIDVVGDLLVQYAGVDTVNHFKLTALHFAVMGRAYELARMLVEVYGADINAFDCSGRTPFHLAIDIGLVELVNYFIGKVDDINCQGPATMAFFGEDDSLFRDEDEVYGGAALHYGAASGNIGIMQIILGHSPDLETQDIYGRTPLHIAAYVNMLPLSNFSSKMVPVST
jgi:cytohesin